MWPMKKRYATATLSIDEVLNKVHFYGEIMQKIRTKARSRPLFNFGK